MILASTTACYLALAVIPSATFDYDPYNGAVEVLKFSFENDQDQDFDGQPDDWTRRKGPNFPSYIKTGIDRKRAHEGSQSLVFDVDGGQAITYSPTVHIDPLHSYVFQGYVRTQMLKHDAAVISISFLNHKRQRVQRFMSQPVTGTHKEWQRIRVGPLPPRHDVKFVVIGCHLVNGKKMDIRGRVWFDDLWLGKLPQLSLVSNFYTHFKTRFASVEVEANVSGLDPNRKYKLHLEMIDSKGQMVDETDIPLNSEVKEEATDSKEKLSETIEEEPKQKPVVWKLNPQNYGFYRIRSTLERDKTVILEKLSTFAVMDLVNGRDRGEFGWSIAHNPDINSLREIADVAGQAGINWLKYPLWQSVDSSDQKRTAEISGLFEQLNRRHITPVGLLNNPPQTLRKQFARDWMGFSEIFTMPPSFWSPSLEPVIARFSSSVRHWQLGTETDVSFVGMSRLPQTLSAVKREFDRIGRDTQIGLHWNWETAIPTRAHMPHAFLSVNNTEALKGPQLIDKLKQSSKSGMPRWVLLKPLARSKHTAEERGADLVRRMVSAKIGGAEAIFAWDVFDQEHGLLNPNGSPTLLYLPWRTTALSLQGAKYLGSFKLRGGSQNYAFTRDGEVVLVIWNEEPTSEEVYLGENVIVSDVWGRLEKAKIKEGATQQIIEVGPIPRIIKGCSEAIAHWRLAVQFEKGKVGSTTGGHPDAVHGQNTFPQGVSGTVTLNIPPDATGRNEWEVVPKNWQLQTAADEKFQLPMVLTLPPNVKLGTEEWWLDFEIAADRPYKFRIYRPFQVGLGDVVVEVIDRKLENGRLEIEQVITNNTAPTETLNFRCSLFVPGNRRQKQIVTKLGKGQDHKFYYLPNAESLKDKELWLRAEQVDGRRVLNYKWTVGQLWEQQALEKAALNSRKKTTEK